MAALLTCNSEETVKKKTGNMHLNVTLWRLREAIFPVEKQ